MLVKKLAGAVKGSILWHGIKRKYGAEPGKTRYLLFCSENIECNFWGILMLSRYISQNKYQKVIVIACYPHLIRAVRGQGNNVFSLVLPKQQMMYLMDYYAMIDMSGLWTAVSVTQPYRTGAHRLLGEKGVTYKEIVYYDIYKFCEPDIAACFAISKEKKKELLRRFQLCSGKGEHADLRQKDR